MSFSLTFEEDAQFAQIRQDAAVCCCQLSLVGPSQFGENDKTTTTVRDGGAAPRLSGPVACEVFFYLLHCHHLLQCLIILTFIFSFDWLLKCFFFFWFFWQDIIYFWLNLFREERAERLSWVMCNTRCLTGWDWYIVKRLRNGGDQSVVYCSWVTSDFARLFVLLLVAVDVPPPPPPNGKLGGEKGRVVTDHHGNRCCQFRLLSLMWLSCLVNVFYLSTRVSVSSLIYVRVTHKLCLAFPFRSVVCPSRLKATSKYPPCVCVCLCGVDIVVHAERGSVRQIVF
jgi:hypothetical protein